ncbi:hypothetical protein EYF80_007667 [Liparis tanakae]|uniref:Uncharacterized protein n=1 Tax=Liparis tanakae TaxID=230148 RepID=A0A4Z2IW13_9TELE|nr:hypothetical protein EYF80_007667 [Liparis tanakae]
MKESKRRSQGAVSSEPRSRLITGLRSRCSRISSLIVLSPSVMGTESRLDVPVTKLSILSDSQIHHIETGTASMKTHLAETLVTSSPLLIHLSGSQQERGSGLLLILGTDVEN